MPAAAATTFSISSCWTFGRSRLVRSPPAKPSICTGISSPSRRELRPSTITTASAAFAAATAAPHLVAAAAGRLPQQLRDRVVLLVLELDADRVRAAGIAASRRR